MEQNNHYHCIHIIVILYNLPSLDIPVVSIVSGNILVETSMDLIVYEQHIAVLLVMMIVDSISTSDTVVYTVLYIGVLYTAMVNELTYTE